MANLTSRERFQRMYEHRDADRIPVIDGPWAATVERWHREGMPTDVSYVDFFDLDHVAGIGVDISPRYPTQTLEETDDYIVQTNAWGVKFKNWKHQASTPEFLDFRIVSPDTWKEARERMRPDRDRVDWKYLESNYKTWREKGWWIQAHLWFGFDVTHSWTIGTERMLIAIIEQPEWVMDMFGHYLDVNLALLDMIWDAGYTFDSINWPDDMGYKHHQFFSVHTYRNILKPFHERAIDWAHAKGIKAHLHSCGDINPLVPELVGLGLDALNPLEVKAGMDPVALKQQYGNKLVLHGGINAMLWDQPEKIRVEMERVVPVMKENGGYIFSSDHSVPSSVSLQDFRQITELAKKLGAY